MIKISRYAFLATSAIAVFTGTGCSNTSKGANANSSTQTHKQNQQYRLQKASFTTTHTSNNPPTHYQLDEDFDTWDRVFRGFQIPNRYSQHPRVQQFVRYYGQNPDQLTMLSERASVFLHMIVSELDNRQMPSELALLPFVESAFDPDIFSHAGAAGLWQFIPSTGNDYGLLQTKSYDARLDPFAATGAALSYLQKLQAEFNGDWLLALAAYNCGEGRVEQEIAINQAKGLPTSFWDLSLPKETREYVPRLLAFKELISHAQQYGIQLPKTPNTARLAQLRVDKPIDLKQLALAAGLSATHLTSLNPCFRKGITTPQYSNRIILPRESAQTLVAIMETLPAASHSNRKNRTSHVTTTHVTYAKADSNRYNKLATVRMGKKTGKVKTPQQNTTTQYARVKTKLRTAQNNSNKHKQVDA